MLSTALPPAVKFQKQWLRQLDVSARKAGPCACRAPHPPGGGAWTGQGAGAADPPGQKLPRPQLRRAQDSVPAGQKWPAAQGAQAGAAPKEPAGQAAGDGVGERGAPGVGAALGLSLAAPGTLGVGVAEGLGEGLGVLLAGSMHSSVTEPAHPVRPQDPPPPSTPVA